MKIILKNILFIILLIFSFNQTFLAQDKSKIDFESCTFKDFPLHGKIKFVDSFPDFTVQIVESFPDVKIKIVDSFPDIKIKFVESFPGKP